MRASASREATSGTLTRGRDMGTVEDRKAVCLRWRRAIAATIAIAIAMATGADVSMAAAPTGSYAPFSDCPYENPEVRQCLEVEVSGGEFKLGKLRIAVLHKTLIQGGSSLNFETNREKFYGAKDGATLPAVGEPVPAGSGLSGVAAVLELARPASEIGLSASNLAAGQGEVISLPVRIRLESGQLGTACYVGSSSSPIYLHMMVGRTSPPPPNSPISGVGGSFVFAEEGALLRDTGFRLVDNAFAAPAATGCGGPRAPLVDTFVDERAGLPAAAGRNTAIFTGNLLRGTATAVRESVR
jgi:hypothetical protein